MRCAWQKRSIPLFIFGLPLARQFRKHLSSVGERACGGGGGGGGSGGGGGGGVASNSIGPKGLKARPSYIRAPA